MDALLLSASEASLGQHTLALCVVLAAALAFSAAIVPAPVTATAAEQQQTRTIRVGYLLDNQGFESGSPDTYMSGWGYEYLQDLSYHAKGWKYEYVTGTFSELMAVHEAGQIDLMSNISYTPERAEKLLYSTNPSGKERYYIYVKSDRDDLTAGDPQSLQGKTIGVNPGVQQTESGKKWLADEGIDVNFKEYATGNDIFKALTDDEVDAIIMNDTLSSGDALPVYYVGESDYYFTVPKSRPGIMAEVNSAMAQIQASNPRYNDEVKTRYSVSNGGSSSLTKAERAWLDARGNTVTFGYLENTRRTPRPARRATSRARSAAWRSARTRRSRRTS